MKNLLVKMPNWLGDAVMATPILHDLKVHFPDAHLTALIKPSLAPLLQGLVDEIHCDLSSLKKKRFDCGVLLTNSFSSAWNLFRHGVKNRIGFANECRSPLLTHALPFPKLRDQQHLVLTYKHLLQPLGIAPSDTAPQLLVTAEEKQEIETSLTKLNIPKKRKLVGINAGAAFGPAKCWLPERFREVAQRLTEEENTYVIFFGDPASAPLIQSICQDLGPRVFNLAGKTTLRQLMAWLATCDAFLTNDSGPMHIAAALKTPLVAIFGSTNEITTGPYNHGTVIHKHVSCSPCYLRECPIDFRCMKQVQVREVLDLLDSVGNHSSPIYQHKEKSHHQER